MWVEDDGNDIRTTTTKKQKKACDLRDDDCDSGCDDVHEGGR